MEPGQFRIQRPESRIQNYDPEASQEAEARPRTTDNAEFREQRAEGRSADAEATTTYVHS